MPFRVEIAASARTELISLPAHVKRPIGDAIDQQLVHAPLTETRNKKQLRNEVTANFGFVPPMWEIRVGEYRVFYDVDSVAMTVTIRSVRKKPPGRTTDEVLHE